MTKTEYGLKIGIDELEEILNQAKNKHKYNNKENCLYFKQNEVIQYSVYQECFPAIYR